MTKLKPCPFCGAEATPVNVDEMDFGVECTNEDECSAKVYGFHSQKNANAAWNKRAKVSVVSPVSQTGSSKKSVLTTPDE